MTDERQALAIIRLLSFIKPTPAELNFLRSIPGADRHAKPNEVICPGVRTDGFFLLLDGWAANSVISQDGDERINSINLPGDMLGMASFIMAAPFDRTYALTPVTLKRVPATVLREIFDRFPRLAATLLLVAQEERAAKNEWNSLHSTSAEKRFAGFLFRIGERLKKLDEISGCGMVIPLTQKHVAEVVGVTPVYIHQLIHQFQKSGLIEYQRGRLQVADSNMLQQLSGLAEWEVVAPSWLPEPA